MSFELVPARILFRAGRFFVLASFILLFALQSSAQHMHLKDNRGREMIEYKMVKNLMIIPLFINGKGPYNFVLDTGVGIFLITDSSLIDTLNIKFLRTIRITGLGEKAEMIAYVTPPLKVNAGSHIGGEFAAAILKKDAFDLSGYAGMPVHGLIGYEFFSSFIVRINYASSFITVYKPTKKISLRKSSVIPLTIEDHKPYMTSDIVLTSGKTISEKLIIDTGAGHPLSLETDDGDPIDLPGENIPANLGIGLAGPITGYLGRIRTIYMGKFALNNVLSAFPNYQDVGSKSFTINRNGNIGNSILKRFTVIFDYSNEKMLLRPAYNFKESFEHDMSGLELSAGGKDYDHIFITRVEPGSPGEQAGLEREDEIISINFKPVSSMSMHEIDNLFHSRSDRSFILDILPKGSTKKEHVLITLKRRI